LLLCGFLCLANDKTPSIVLSFTGKYWMTKVCTSGLKLLEHKYFDSSTFTFESLLQLVQLLC